MKKPIKILRNLHSTACKRSYKNCFRVIAAVVYKNEILFTGINQNKTDPLHFKYKKNKDAIYVHAETDAIKKALNNKTKVALHKCDLYVCRVKYFNKKSGFGLAKPCCGCSKAIKAMGFRRLYYSLDCINKMSYAIEYHA